VGTTARGGIFDVAVEVIGVATGGISKALGVANRDPVGKAPAFRKASMKSFCGLRRLVMWAWDVQSSGGAGMGEEQWPDASRKASFANVPSFALSSVYFIVSNAGKAVCFSGRESGSQTAFLG